MSEVAPAVQAALDSDTPIPRDLVAEWCQVADDVRSLALLYRLTGEAYDRIVPPLGQQETCRLIQKYLLACLRLNPEDGVAFSRYQAAWTLVSWFQHLSRLPDTMPILRDAASTVTQLYLESDAEVRTAIETGFLEHVLEDEEFRPLFAGWAQDDRLSETWQAALAWGEPHPGFTRGLATSQADGDSGNERAVQQGVEADEARQTSELRSLTPVLGRHPNMRGENHEYSIRQHWA
jgi:hypothetical protein